MARQTFEVSLSVKENGRNAPEYTLDTDLNGEVTLADLLKWTKTSLITIAYDTLKEEQSMGFDEKPIMLVDGRRGKPIENVSPLGKIEFFARQNFGEILLEAYEALHGRSKVLTGRYKSSHYVFHNGNQVATDIQSLNAWLKSEPTFKDSDKVRIVNIQPYARRLELLGVTAQRTQNRRVDAGRRSKKKKGTIVKMPNGAYYLTSRAIRAKYKQNTFVKFSFVPGSSLGLSGSFKNGRAGRNSAGRPYLYPSILFTLTERGLTDV